MNEEPRQRGGAMRLVAPLAAAVLIVLLAAITISGHWPELKQMVRFAGKGLVASAPSDITQVEIRAGQESVALSPRDRRLDDRRHDRGGAGRACFAYRHRLAASACQRAGARDRARRVDAGELCGIRPRSAGERRDARRCERAGGDGEFRRAQSGRHLAICPRRRIAHGLSDAAACRQRVASRGRHGAPLARAGRVRSRGPRAEPVAAGLDGANLGGRDRDRRQAHPLRTRQGRQLVSACRPAFAHRRLQCPRRRPGAGSRHRGRARSRSMRPRSRRASAAPPTLVSLRKSAWHSRR